MLLEYNSSWRVDVSHPEFEIDRNSTIWHYENLATANFVLDQAPNETKDGHID
jgi:hypothetical protein